ncbi:protein kinase domain-containing protein [Endozoicomonas sp.]|uniref:protein kinase domain-containing protein n=1 Tax=Endozoicomonas sp. TaxID=1892382 RepID=UPI003AF7139A
MGPQSLDHSGSPDVRSFFSRMRACFSTLTCGCFGRSVRSYQMPDANLNNSASSTSGMPANYFDRTVTLGGKEIRIQQNPIYRTFSQVPAIPCRQPLTPPIPERQPLTTANVPEDFYYGRTAHPVLLMQETFIDTPLGMEGDTPSGPLSPGSTWQAQHRCRPEGLIIRQRSFPDQFVGACSLDSWGQSTPMTSVSSSVPPRRLPFIQRGPVAHSAGSRSHPTSPTQQLFINTDFHESHSSCPTTPDIRSPFQAGFDNAVLAFQQANPDSVYSLVSSPSHVELDESFSNPEHMRLYSFDRDKMIGTGTFCAEAGGVISGVYIPENFSCAFKPVGKSKTGQNEITLLGELMHPNIANMFSPYFDKQSGKQYVVMEDGGKNLKVMMEERGGGLDPEDIKMILPQQLVVVDYLYHEKGIIHGDLKLDNMLYRDGRLKACDFGLARRVGEAPAVFVLVPSYVPPETMNFENGKPSYNISAENVDIWSIGCTLAELVTGQKLFPLDEVELNAIAKKAYITLSGMKSQIDQAAEAIKSALGDDISELFIDMMQLDPGYRITPSEALQRPCIIRLKSKVPKPLDSPFFVNGMPQEIPLVNQY